MHVCLRYTLLWTYDSNLIVACNFIMYFTDRKCKIEYTMTVLNRYILYYCQFKLVGFNLAAKDILKIYSDSLFESLEKAVCLMDGLRVL